MKLFCFTHAGGTAAFFNQFEKEAENAFKVVKLEYAGHGKRHKEPFCQNFSELADDLYGQMERLLAEHETYALFGYSMGSIAVVEVLRKIAASRGIHFPVHVFLAAHEPYTKLGLEGYDFGQADEFVKQRTIQFGAVPESLIGNTSFWRVYLPVYRADYSMICRYQFADLDLKTDVPATVFFSEADTPYADMVHWTDYFVGDCSFFQYAGNHFFIKEHCKEIVNAIKKRLEIRKF